MSQLVNYPRLYQVLVPGTGPAVDSVGDQAVSELYRLYQVGDRDTQNLSFRFRVLDCALRLFGDFRQWMILQRNNPDLVGYNLEFLRDTLAYIIYGRRSMSPMIWGDLVRETQDHMTTPHHLSLPDLAVPDDLTTAQVLQLWCSRKGGFEDLLQSLFVLFGTERGEGR